MTEIISERKDKKFLAWRTTKNVMRYTLNPYIIKIIITTGKI